MGYKYRMNPLTGLLDIVGLENIEEASNTDIDTGTETVDSFEDTDGKGAMWAYVVSKAGTDRRTGIILASWDGVSGSTPVYTDGLSTGDIGDTSGVTFAVDKDGNTVRLRCTVASDDWAVNAVRTLMG